MTETPPSADPARLSVTFDPSGRKVRSALIRALYGDQVTVYLWVLFGMVIYVMAAWIVAVALCYGFDLDRDVRDGLASVLIVVLLSIGYWQQWSKSSAALHMGVTRFSVSVEPEGLKVSSPLYDVRCDWSAVDRIDIRKDHLIVTYLKSRGVAIPVTAFGGETALRAFVAAAQSHRGGVLAA